MNKYGLKITFRNAALIGVGLFALASAILLVLTAIHMRALPNDLAQLTQASYKPQLLDRNGRPLTITYANDWNAHEIKSLHRIPSFLQRAFILAEDQRFYSHDGVDWRARSNAVLQNFIALKGVRGASTISEQVVRMIHPRSRNLWSRWLEGWEAQALEVKFDKATILEFYLNQVPFAAQRRGVQQAARYYFDRDVSTLNEKEMLALAVLVRAPSYLDLHKGTERIQGRLAILLGRAEQNGLVTSQSAVRELPLALQTSELDVDALHFSNYLYRDASQSEHRIKTTLDASHQNFAQKLLAERLSKLGKKRVANAAMLVVDYLSDEVLVWAVATSAAKPGVAQGGAAYDSVLVRRQPGSTLKPFVYATAMEKGWSAATVIDDSPLKVGVGRGVHSYRNYSNTFYGPVSLRTALGNSLNIPAVKAAQYVGPESLLDKLNKLGIHDLDLRTADYGDGIALGNGEISLFSLVGAYASLARGGLYRPLKTRAKQHSAGSSTVFSNEISSIISDILSDPEARSLEFGRGSTLQLPVQTAVKTGTSNDYRDAWVIGYNDRYVVGVWMGNLDNQTMDNVTGSNGPALVLRSMFAELNRHRSTKALALSRELVSHTVCVDSGLLANDQCASRQEWFRPSNVPGKESRTARAETYSIAFPLNQMQVARDPRIPDEHEALEFKLNNANDVEKVEWLLNDQLIASTHSASYLWPVKAGHHRVAARIHRYADPEVIITGAVSIEVK